MIAVSYMIVVWDALVIGARRCSVTGLGRVAEPSGAVAAGAGSQRMRTAAPAAAAIKGGARAAALSPRVAASTPGQLLSWCGELFTYRPSLLQTRYSDLSLLGPPASLPPFSARLGSRCWDIMR